MKNKKRLLILLTLIACTVLQLQAQVYNEMDEFGNIRQRDENGGSFNPNKRDSTKNNKEVPKGVWAWTVDRKFGDIRKAQLDTMPHLYQNSIYNTGVFGEYNSTGNNYTARLNRIFIDRKPFSEFFFVDPYDYTTKEPEDFLYLNTLSPYTHISYDNCGDKQNGEDHIDAKFGINAGKRLGMGFDLDYYYGRGYYQNQANSHFRASLYATYVGDRYQMHFLGSAYHRKATENGGIVNDNYITHPELETTQYSEDEIPTVLSRNYNRNNSQHLFFSHRYNIGFYRKVKMTDEEIKARQFAQAAAKDKEQREAQKKTEGMREDNLGRRKNEPVKEGPKGRPDNAKIMGDEPGTQKDTPADSTRIKVESQEAMDSLMAEKAKQDSIDATMKKEYVPVTSIIHTLDLNNYERTYNAAVTPDNYYADTFYDTDDEGNYGGVGVNDKYKYFSVKNTFGLALLEGFNKYMKAGLKGFVSYEMRNYKMPAILEGATEYYLAKHSEHCLNVGGQLSKTQGRTFHFNLAAELGVTGMQSGALAVDFDTDLNFKLWGDTLRLAAKAFFHRTKPSFFHENYMSKHLMWDQSLNAETRTHIEGLFTYEKTRTQLRVAVEELQNYIYYGMSYNTTSTGREQLTGGVFQESGNINVLTAQLKQDFTLGVLNWENVITYQNSSNKDVLPLPDLNVFTNLYLKFRIAKVLLVELGGCATYFTKYYAPDYLPQIGQFAIQKNEESKKEIGGYPFVDVYANFHLKRTRFFIAMSHVNAGSGSKEYFLTPHYPTNTRVLRFGVSWNFYN